MESEIDIYLAWTSGRWNNVREVLEYMSLLLGNKTNFLQSPPLKSIWIHRINDGHKDFSKSEHFN